MDSSNFTAERRAELLAEAFPLMRRLSELEGLAGPAYDVALREIVSIGDRLRLFYRAYADGVPVIELSRCPFSQEVWKHSLDTFGLDGLWWNCHKPIRPASEPYSPHYLAFQGAVKVADPLPVAPFLVVPGPEKPFVITRLLERPHVKAVVSHVKIGNLDAYPIVYFGTAVPTEDDRTNDWGANTYSFNDKRGGLHTGEYCDAEDLHDYALGPWLESEKLLWIEPGDKKLAVQKGAKGCPYVDLPGKSDVWRLEEGELWFGEDVE